MKKNIESHIKPSRLGQLPEELRHELKTARTRQGWTQAELGRLVGLPQMHISGIETGKIVPRFDTLLDLARVLAQDLLMVPRELVPMVQSLVRDHRRKGKGPWGEEGERPLYAMDNNDDISDESGFGGGNYGRSSKGKKKKRNEI